MSDDLMLDDDLLDDERDAAEGETADRSRASAGRRRSASTNRWMRWLHVYTSMISLIIVLFFGLTGLTLNHPDWTLGDEVERTSTTGTLPADYLDASGAVDFLAVSEFARSEYDVSGSVTDYYVNGDDGSLSYKAPGYAADLTFSVSEGTYEIIIEQQGFVAVMNDLHKGRDAPSSWKWVIDLSALLLVVVSVTGLGIQLFQRKRRTRALVFAAAGLVVTIVFTLIALA